MTTPIHLAIILASTRSGRFADTVVRWFSAEADGQGGSRTEVIDLADHPLPLALPSQVTPEIERLSERLSRADGFVVVTPEYNHSFPAPLKQAIDVTYDEWHAKPVGFVSYGGISGGLRAVEQLRQVFAEMHAVTVRDTVSFHGASACFDETGTPRDPEGPSVAAKQLLRQITWWAHALRDARLREPYAA